MTPVAKPIIGDDEGEAVERVTSAATGHAVELS